MKIKVKRRFNQKESIRYRRVDVETMDVPIGV
jgi:hypothetical protein